ncbi:uncharacterized protein L969DRAFT_90393 [Mixia osmundae IAM 14324]|uniref:BSD domain-containing protein n=1 Tax=Mixia osmundae (strain CBS 9802 / IAM 14324 / JCM 22182 / KY 12970) TaxID=764103 RepID=G7E2C5_MIXOS|nr:uncharacterized protein L969DRAFT_90393 [Mixia osmundae IAM 14324]KEI36857.1 hypothetical protein L969DRAFT_90393 [Mixia osmundae IAM 14324]GAA96985.1 hypothetical protein E5Q_03659 [Mixia osmundae IAM 14324]
MVEAGASSAICSALTSYKKAPGTLVLKRDQGLQWTPRPDQSSSGDLIVPASDISSIFASKEGAAKVILKVVTTDPVTHQEASHSFLFTSAASAVSEREMFKRELSDVVASARAAQEGAAAEATKKRDKGKGKAADPIQDPAVRARLLRRDAELGQLFKDLVMTDIIPESEFWEGREHLLLAEALADNQTRGRSGQMVDPRPETSSSGELTMKITPQLIHDIFEQLPIVQRAYNDNVPKPLSEEQFWLRYFQSKLHERNRASARNSDSLMKDDPIFDKYLDLPDDDLEPQNPIDEPIYPLLNLEATSNDHEETGNTRDYTMQAGKQKGSLPLMRRFNEHSQRMLDIALGESDRRAGVIDGGNAGARNYYSDIVLDDLQDTREDDRITLNMEQQAKHFDTLGTQSGKRKLTEDQVEDVFEETRQHYRNWDPDLSQFKPDKSVINETAESLMRNIRTRFQAKETKHSSAFPEGLLREMVSCQAAANEFLRLYWSACLPARPDDISPAASATPAQKAQKAQRMITYLGKTSDRIQVVLQSARDQRVDVELVKLALQPLEGATSRAMLHHHRNQQRN